MEQITSMQNPKVRLLLDLQQKSVERRRRGLFVVEGRREIERCMQQGYEIDTVFCCPDIYGGQWQHGGRVVYVSAAIYNKVAYRGSTEGVIAEVCTRQLSLSQLSLPDKPLVVVMERVEKPGNLGAVLRSADAAGVNAVIVCDPLTDLFNPNLIRSSTGAFFSVPCVTCTSQECIEFLRSHHIRILTAQLQDSSLYYAVDMRCPTAIVMGTEATGLTDLWREAADAHIRIPMLGTVDSLNVSVSAAILMYEAVRQRRG
ncbi:MAG: RNA methyltransferase [Prevotella sp.]|nr:RNA methyltransferase [Prevotella sp.]